MQASCSGITFGIFVFVLTKMSKCPPSRTDVFVDQIVFCVGVRKVKLNKWIFNDLFSDVCILTQSNPCNQRQKLLVKWGQFG